MDDIDAIAMAGGQAAGVPTGFADLDNLTNGLYPGQMIMWRPGPARPGPAPGSPRSLWILPGTPR